MIFFSRTAKKLESRKTAFKFCALITTRCVNKLSKATKTVRHWKTKNLNIVDPRRPTRSKQKLQPEASY